MPSKLTSSDIDNIGNQSPDRSAPFRKNFTALKNKINEVIDALAAAAIGTTNAETTAARPYHTSLLDRLDSGWKGQYNYVKSGGVVSINGSDAQKVDVSAGEAKVDGADVKWSGVTSGTIAYTVANTRYDVLVINSDSTISVVTGTAAASPKFPACSTSQKALAVLLVTTSAVSIFYQMYATMDRDLFDGDHYNTTAVTPYGLKKREIFTADGTWYKPAGVTQVHVTLVGAGGAGGNGGGTESGGGGGGAGQVVTRTVAVAGNVTITLSTSGPSSFGSLEAAKGQVGGNGSGTGVGQRVGGIGGLGANGTGLRGYSLEAGAGGTYLPVSPFTVVAATAGKYGSGGGGGTGGGPADAAAGGPGYNHAGGSSGGAGGGGGGAGGWGGPGANGGAFAANGDAATGYGAGGGGAGAQSGNLLGGAGGPPICIVEWEE